MKLFKYLLPAMLVTVSFSATAAETVKATETVTVTETAVTNPLQNPYVKAGWVFGFLEAKGGGNSADIYIPGFNAALGATFLNTNDMALRADVDWTYRSFEFDTDGMDTDALINTFSGNAYLDFKTSTGFTPYVGVMVGLSWLSLDDSHKLRPSFGAGFGAAYQINENIALDAGYKYSYLGKIDGMKVRTSDLSIGLRFAF